MSVIPDENPFFYLYYPPPSNIMYLYFWYKCFKDGRKRIADDSRSGRSLTSTSNRNIGQVRDLIVADRKIAIDNISEILGISYGSCQKLLVG
ncbi:hypothetical protein LAZ67_11002103 [Cordylochernes scorpioides]|uniref:Uncharacterized protein n=1 Tax=Cordylochernes scorpioides TaxID=51811 RepID=A0ABY6KYZ1_9ARAC|nr:hypothetical protein LAZ67_11002103 [Cordylochernes scorpioides]